jgi:hypothetical protein
MNEAHLEPRPGQGMNVPPLPQRAVPGAPAPMSLHPTVVKAPMPVKAAGHQEPLSLVEDHVPAAANAAPVQSKIHGFSVGVKQQWSENWKRQTHVNAGGAIRVRSFHGRLSEQGLEYMDHLINDWLDGHPEVEIKNVTSSVGMFDGKMKEPAVILNLWY